MKSRRLMQIARRGQSLPKGSVVRHSKIAPPMTALGLGCVKTFWRGRTPASTNSRIPGQAKLAMFLQLRAGIDCIACPAAVSDLVVVSRIWARRCPALTPGSPP
jgi:hypothetical protein